MNPATKRRDPPTIRMDATQPRRKKQWRTPKKNQPANMAHTINPGDAGIWATCNMHKEAKATTELRDLFEDYAVKMFGEDCLVHSSPLDGNVHDRNAEVDTGNVDATHDDDEESGNPPVAKISKDVETDIEAEIASEIRGIKGSRSSQSGEQHQKQQPLFQAVRIDVQCVLFFKTRAPVEPVSFVERICRDAVEGKGIRRSRCVKRLTPMTRMGKASWEALGTLAKGVLEPVFSGAEKEKKKVRLLFIS